MRLSAAWLVALSPWVVSRSAAAAEAETPSLVISLRAPKQCPSREVLHAEVLRLARVGPDFERRLEAKVTIARRGAADFSLTLRTRLDGVDGERDFEGASCQAVTEAAAVTLALMLNPEVEQPAATEAEPEPEPRSAVAPQRAADQPEHSAARPKRQPAARGPRTRGALAAHAGIQTGVLPNIGPEFTLGFGVAVHTVSAWLAASYAPSQDARISGQDAGGRLQALSASALACWAAFTRGGAELGPCAGAELSRVEGRGIGVDDPDEGAIHWTSAALGATGAARIAPRIALRAGLFGMLPLQHPRVVLEDIGEVHEAPALSGRAQVGLSVELW